MTRVAVGVRSFAVVLCLVAALPGCSRCGAPPAKGGAGTAASVDESQVTPAELAAFLDWQVELGTLMKEVMDEAKRDLDTRDPSESVESSTARMMERTKNAQARSQPLLAREPFKGTRKGDAIKAVIQAFYVSGTFFRDEKELTRLRASHGKALIDSIANQEALLREKLSP